MLVTLTRDSKLKNAYQIRQILLNAILGSFFKWLDLICYATHSGLVDAWGRGL